MRKLIVTMLSAMLVCFAVQINAQAVPLSDEDAEFLVRAVAAEYPELSFAARVAIIATVSNRVQSTMFPETAAGVISSYRNSAGELMFRVTDLTNVERRFPQSYKMTRDAYLLVCRGADPTGGALSFEVLTMPRTEYDLRFDDGSEQDRKTEEARISEGYKLVIDGVGFYG